MPLRELVDSLVDNDAGSSDRSSLRLLPSRLTYETDNTTDESNSNNCKKEWSDSVVKALVEFVLTVNFGLLTNKKHFGRVPVTLSKSEEA